VPDSITLSPARELAELMPPRPDLDVEAIIGRAAAAPGGQWTAFTNMVQIPWSDPGDDEPSGQFDFGRYLVIAENPWHTGSDDPPPELFAFLTSARNDVLALASEVLWLRAQRTAACPDAA